MHCHFRNFIAVLVLVTGVARGASPTLTSVLPRGGQRGNEIDLTLGGDRLADAKELLFYRSGLRVVKLDIVNPQQLKVRLAIAADAPLGEHALRVRTASGISELRTFWVGAMPVVPEKEPNSDFTQPQKVDLNVTVSGVIDAEDIDYFCVDAKKGQRITAEIEAMRLATTFFDPYVAILDENRFELSASDDTALLLQDSIASMVAPKDGRYIIQVRDASYGGDGNHHYRLHIGTFPRPRALFPAGGPAGQEIHATFLGDVAGTIEQQLKLPAQPAESLSVFAEQNGQPSPSPDFLRISPFANVLEAEPNNEPAKATNAPGELPLALNGIIAEKNDVDYFRFHAKKDQALDVNVYARRFRSPLDPVLTVCDAKGNAIATNDDTNGPDSYLRFTVPADGEYTLSVSDHLRQGGADYVYRVELVPARPQVALTIPLVAANSQDRQTIVIPRGNSFATLVRATRVDFAGELKLAAEGLPPGVTMHCDPVAAGLDVVPVVFEAAADAPTAATVCSLIAKPVDAKASVESTFSQTADLVVYGNQIPLYQVKVNKLAIAIADEAPFKLRIVAPKVPLVQNGSMSLKIVAERKSGFKGPINLQLPFNPPGVSSGPVTIAENATEVTLPLNAAADAQVRKWKICVLGSADSTGTIWVSSPLADLEIAPPLVAMKIEMAAAEQGKSVPVLCSLDQKVPFTGSAKAQLLGLPPHASAADAQFTSADSKVIFNVKTEAKTPVGQHGSLFCSITVTRDGEPIVQSTGQGGVLRVDPSPPAPATTPPPAAAPAAVPPPDAKPLSRLEKLRQEQAQRIKQP